MDKVKRHKKVLKELHRLYKRKNADYSDSFCKVRCDYPNAILIRLTDKIERLKSLYNCVAPRVKDESVRDTLLDLANYAILEVVELDAASEES